MEQEGRCGGAPSCDAESYIRCLMLFSRETSGPNAQDKNPYMSSMLNYKYGCIGMACILGYLHRNGPKGCSKIWYGYS